MTKRMLMGIIASVLATNCIVFVVTSSILDRRNQQELWLQFQRDRANQIRVDIAIALKIRHGHATEAGGPHRLSALQSLESQIDLNLVPFRNDIQQGRALSFNELDALKRASLYREKYPPNLDKALQVPEFDSVAEEVLKYGGEHGTLDQPEFMEQLK
jgi:hypothetical protein